MKEKIIQFGEGGFLRGFADWMIQYVNEKTDFDGSVVVVQPIEKGMCDLLSEQNCEYTHICRGTEGVETKKIKVKIQSIPSTCYIMDLEISLIGLKKDVYFSLLPFGDFPGSFRWR